MSGKIILAGGKNRLSLRESRDLAILNAIGQEGNVMREVSATEMKSQFGESLDLTRDEPVGIRKSGKLTAVMVLADEYEHLQRLRGSCWIARTQRADERREWVSYDDAMAMLTERLKQK